MRTPRHHSLSRFISLALLCSAAVLAGCASKVPLDEQANKPAPITSAAPSGSYGSGNSVPSTSVAPVVADKEDAGANANDLVRVIYFDFDSNVVKEEYRPVIEAHAKRLMANKGKKIIIEGHTDERGGREYNLALGQRRAEAVQKSLGLLGVSNDQMEAVSYGEERPAVQGSTEEAWAKNRRAEIKDR